jgi:hypothetical protein
MHEALSSKPVFPKGIGGFVLFCFLQYMYGLLFFTNIALIMKKNQNIRAKGHKESS